MIARWKAGLACSVFWSLGRFGIAATLVMGIVFFVVIITAAGLIDELRRQLGAGEFDHIETRHTVDRALRDSASRPSATDGGDRC